MNIDRLKRPRFYGVMELLKRLCSIRCSVIVLFLSTSFLCTFIIYITQLIGSFKNVQILSRSRNVVHHSYVKETVNNFFDDGSSTLLLVRKVVERGEFEFENPTEDDLSKWFNAYVPILESSKYLQSFVFGTINGSTFGIIRDHIVNTMLDSRYLLLYSNGSEVNNGEPGPWYLIPTVDDEGTEIAFNKSDAEIIPSYDHRAMAWWSYSLLLEREEVGWMQNLNTLKELELVCATKIYKNVNGNLKYSGSSHASYTMTYLEDVLRKIHQEMSPSARLLMIDVNTDNILASSHNVLVKYDDEGLPERVKLSDIEEKTSRVIAKYVKTKSNSFMDMNLLPEFFNYNDHVVKVFKVNVTNLNVIVISSIPIYVIFKGVIISVAVCTSLSISLMAIVMIFSILFGYCVTRPLLTLSKEISKIRDMNLNGIVYKSYMFWETKKLQESFKFTVEKLKLFQAFIPKELYQKIAYMPFADETPEKKEGGFSDLISEESSRSSLTESSTSRKTCVSEINKPFRKFEIGLYFQQVVVLRLLFSSSFLISDDKLLNLDFGKDFGLLMDFFVEKIKRGILVDYNESEFVFTFIGCTTAITSAVYIQHFLNTTFGGKYDYMLFLDNCTVIKGIIGSSSTKKKMFTGDFREFSNSIFKDERSIKQIIITENLHSLVKKTCYYYKPFDMYKVYEDGNVPNQFTCCNLYIFEKEESELKDEWMYELKQKENNMKFVDGVEGLIKIKNGEIDEAKKMFMIYSQDDSLLKNFYDICNLMLEKKINTSDLLKHGKIFCSVFDSLKMEEKATVVSLM